MSTHNTSEIFKGQIYLPGKYALENIQTIIEGKFLLFYWNSMYTSFLASVLCIFASAMAGYGIAKYNFKIKKHLMMFILLTMMVPGQISLIGYIIEMKNFGLSNTHWPIILFWGASSYGVFFMMQYIREAVPIEVIESARIDGCNEFRIFLQIVSVFIKPAIGTLFMLIFLWSWNNYLLQIIVINAHELFTIPLGIQSLANAYVQDWGARGAGLTASIIPMLIIFSIGSKSFIQGISAGAVKG
jgi:multiple sugar transport system permease protein/cellobiose transport system permease protein